MYTNVRGMKSKKNSLIEILHDFDPHLFFLTETQLRSNVGMNIEGYKFYGRKREGKNGGGVGILVRNDILEKTAPHISNRNTEIMWVSVHRNRSKPLFLGVYYGKQESRTNKLEIEMEMSLLKEEINEMKIEGDIMITMDGNARIGLLGEEISRNGHLILQVFHETGLKVLNGSNKCKGEITRKNTKNEDEKSAIDFVVVNDEAEQMVTEMIIDENELYKVKGKNATDHNTICVNMNLKDLNNTKVVKKTDWNLRASSEKWAKFGDELVMRQPKAEHTICNGNIPFQERYRKWYSQLDSAARNSIGKTTFKAGGKEKFSHEVKDLQQKKKEAKTEIMTGENHDERIELIRKYKEAQDKVTAQIEKERYEITKQKFERIAADKSMNTFWKEKKRITRDPVLEALTIKDENGYRQFHPDSVKKHTAHYYEKLYQGQTHPPQPYHLEVQEKSNQYLEDRDYENFPYNLVPNMDEIIEAIEDKTNGKSTTDVKNEMLKRPGEKMGNFLYPLIKTIWEEEEIPNAWNLGQITSIWKGKGDKEKLNNHRGITTSSSIGTILETLIDHRIEAHVPFTQAQGGGKRGSSTCDHLFILRAIIDLSKHNKKETFLTFMDVSKAYDNADSDDMLKTVWESGLKGKSWRILRNMSKNLRATVKTKHGLTEEFEMLVGGRQGSKLTGRLFSKMMDLLAEKTLDTQIGFPLTPEIRIPVLLWVDDVISCVEGVDNQRNMLNNVDQFGKDHKLRWGQEKCQVMRVGRHKTTNITAWKIGDMEIEETKTYKYLGDVISNDGKNTKNIEARKNKLNGTTISIKTIAASEALNKIETSLLLEMHESINLSALLTNAESWNLNKGENEELERMEINAIKLLFNMPTHIPTPALIHSFGLLYTSLRVEQKQLLYLWKVLNRNQGHWTLNALVELTTNKIGWGKTIHETLVKYDLPTNLETIKNLRKNEWKNKVTAVIEKRNTERLIQDCHKIENGRNRRKTKTAHIVDLIEKPTYQRTPLSELLKCTKHETKTILTARHGMLECGKNYKGSKSTICRDCNEYDDEGHRLNYCRNFRVMNNFDNDTKVDYDLIFSDDMETLREIIHSISKVWNTRNANGSMNSD